MILNFIKNKDCSGCGACKEICSQEAIVMKEDEEGFLQPHLLMDKCINCNACDKVCPIKNSDLIKSIKCDAYAAINKNKKVLNLSSSGGIFSVIADFILKNNGIVYGASFDENLKLIHKGVKHFDELNDLRGSKYFQSYSFNCFSEIKEHLKNGKLVYFTGTGCQVAALKLYLHKEYDNLITSDLICHGVPSHLLFDNIISVYEKKYKRKVLNYKFRDKYANGWSSSQTVKYIKNGKTKNDLYNPILASYIKAFMSADFFRESCYNCPFACVNRCGDITLADYWNIEKYHKFNSINGVSALLVNTLKGEKILSLISSNIKYINTNIEYIKAENTNLHTPSKRTDYRSISYKELSSNALNTLMRYTNTSKKAKIKFWIKHYMLSFKLYFLYYTIKNI